MSTPQVTKPRLDVRTLVSDDLFDKLARRVAAEHEIGRPRADRIVSQALVYLQAITLDPPFKLAPPLEVDWGWHMFILHTREYAEFCERLWGKFIHHNPADKITPVGVQRIMDTADFIQVTCGLPLDYEFWIRDGSGCHNACHADCDGSGDEGGGE